MNPFVPEPRSQSSSKTLLERLKDGQSISLDVAVAANAATSVLERVVRGIDSRKKTQPKRGVSLTGRSTKTHTPLISVRVWGGAHSQDGPKIAPAWTDGQQIWIASETFVDSPFGIAKVLDQQSYLAYKQNISPLRFIDFSILRGAVYHEMAHILYTGRAGSYARETMMGEGGLVKSSWNLLEDHRIETIFVRRYSGAIPHFVKTVYGVVLKHSSETGLPDDALHYLWGRKYLPLEHRVRAFDQFVTAYGYELAKESCALIDAFVFASQRAHTAAVAPKSAVRVKAIEDLAGIVFRFNEIRKEIRCTPWAGETSKGHDGIAAGRPSQESPLPEQGESEIPEQGESEIPEPEGDTSQNLGEAGEAVSPEPVSGESTQASGSGQDTLEGQLRESLDRAEEHIRADTRSLKEATSDALYKATLIISKVYRLNPISLEARLCEGSIRRSLDRITDRLAAGVVKRNRKGRLNPVRWEREKNLDSAFDLWKPSGTRAAEVDVMVLTDTSGSMGIMAEPICEVAWSVKSAIEGSGVGRVGVLSFDAVSRWLYRVEDRVSTAEFRYTSASGSTDPSLALKESVKILSASTAPSKLLVILTDGQFSKHHITEQAALAKARGITVLGVFYTARGSEGEETRAKLDSVKGRSVTDPASITPIEAGFIRAQSDKRRKQNRSGESSEYHFGAERLDREHDFTLTFTCFSPKGFAKVIEKTVESLRDVASTGEESQWVRSRRRSLSNVAGGF